MPKLCMGEPFAATREIESSGLGLFPPNLQGRTDSSAPESTKNVIRVFGSSMKRRHEKSIPSGAANSVVDIRFLKVDRIWHRVLCIYTHSHRNGHDNSIRRCCPVYGFCLGSDF